MTSSQSSHATLIAAPSDLQATVQRRVLYVLAQQIMLGGLASSSNALGFETLHQILQASGHTLLVDREAIVELLPPTAAGVPHSGICRKGLFGATQDRFSMHESCSRRSFARAPSSLHQHAWTVWSTGGHEYHLNGGGESLLGCLGRDIDEAARGGP